MKQTYTGSCHCGDVRFEADMDLDHVRVCDCSLCRKRGALNHRIAREDLRILSNLDDMTLYQWHTMTARDYFCPRCGILPFRQPRTAPDMWAVNVRCLDDVDLDAIPVDHVHGSELD
jgi:hypothetical protein